jgi:hypothetical protein
MSREARSADSYRAIRRNYIKGHPFENLVWDESPTKWFQFAYNAKSHDNLSMSQGGHQISDNTHEVEM